MAHGVSMIQAIMLFTKSITAYAILVAIDDRNFDMPQGPQIMEHDAAPQHEAPTDHRVAAEGSTRAGMARTAPMLRRRRRRRRRSVLSQNLGLVMMGGDREEDERCLSSGDNIRKGEKMLVLVMVIGGTRMIR